MPWLSETSPSLEPTMWKTGVSLMRNSVGPPPGGVLQL
jgi:hypothetical protein